MHTPLLNQRPQDCRVSTKANISMRNACSRLRESWAGCPCSRSLDDPDFPFPSVSHHWLVLQVSGGKGSSLCRGKFFQVSEGSDKFPILISLQLLLFSLVTLYQSASRSYSWSASVTRAGMRNLPIYPNWSPGLPTSGSPALQVRCSASRGSPSPGITMPSAQCLCSATAGSCFRWDTPPEPRENSSSKEEKNRAYQPGNSEFAFLHSNPLCSTS